MKKLLLLLFPLMMFAQDSPLIGDVDCDGEVNSQDASLILQFVTSVIDELPCQDNMTGLTPEQLQEIINLMDEQININYTGGGGGSNYPAMISSISSEAMFIGEAFVYCNDLEEDGYTDWFLPNLELLTFAISGGCELPDERTTEYIWSSSHSYTNSYDVIRVRESYVDVYDYNFATAATKCRCVRFGEGETSEGPSGSSNSSGSSVGGSSEQTITMIGPMFLYGEFPDFINYYSATSNNMYYLDAIRFCDDLEYNDYNDWFLPSNHQIQNFINDGNDVIIPNYSAGSYEFLLYDGFMGTSYKLYINQGVPLFYSSTPGTYSDGFCFCVR